MEASFQAHVDLQSLIRTFDCVNSINDIQEFDPIVIKVYRPR